MIHHYADDGRILTPPTELESFLRSSFPAFIKLLGHIRFFYIADEIWDGKSSLIFNTEGEQLVAIILDEGAFHVHIANEKIRIIDESLLDSVFGKLKKTVPVGCHRPFEQLTATPDPNVYPCGYRCDMCLGSKKSDKDNFSKSEDFVYMNWVCYHNCVPGFDVGYGHGVFDCKGCNKNNNKFCRSVTCSKEKGFAHCAECGDYRSCDVYRDSHYAGQCNLGITAEEVMSLVIPYCMKERLDVICNSLQKI